ncbi:hypothetical protein ACFQS3_12305 [Glycomyces mayteni]|uniref:Uncharacterized protein n=1 Tax=Glycomyces mayteni TaxID=543887 RepID=A0ABW2D9T2_9ACTN
MADWRTESTPWSRGPWSIERRGAELADIAFAGRTVLRSVRAAARDRDWNTPAWDVALLDDAETLRLGLRWGPLAGTLTALVRDAALVIDLDLEASEPFPTNRTGLVALHPPRLAGTALRATHSDGSEEDTWFPAAISPHQPVLDIAALAWEHDGLAVDLAFTGDVFEMEDQRNWTDASFKTYSRPLALPAPYELAAGARVRQSITVTAEAHRPPAPTPDAPRVELIPGGLFPEISLGAATAPSSEADPAPDVAPLGGTVLVEVDLRAPNWPAALDRAAAAGLPLDVRAVVPRSGANLAAFAEFLAPLPIARVAAFDPDTHVTDAPALDALQGALARAGLHPPLVGGSRAHFTELNRNLAAIPDAAEVLAFATTPLFHDTSTEQLLEAVAMQRLAARQAVAESGGRMVLIGPVTLRPRFNNATADAPLMSTRSDLADGYGAEFTGAADPRQSDDPLAAWTIAAAAALAVPGVAGLAWFEEWGPRGIRSAAGDDYPVAAVLETLDEMSAGELLWAERPDEHLWALGSRAGGRVRIAAANLDRRPRSFTVAAGDEEFRLILGPLGWAVID